MTAELRGRLADLPAAASSPHPTAVAVFTALNRAGVGWCLLRGEGRLQAPLHDVVTELSYGPGYAIETRAAAGCLARRERVGELRLLAADDAFWTLLLHC